MSFNIQGKTALITGANRGIGRVLTESCIRHGAHKVYAAVRDVDSAASLVEAHGDKVVPIPIDVTKPATVTAAAHSAGDVQLVVNNAGVLRTATPLDDVAVEALQHEIDVNVFGLIRMAQAFAPVLKANGGGAFVQLNSVASMKSFVSFATYCASKAAAYSITQALRELLEGQGTLVVSVHPGPIATDMADEAGIREVASPASVVAEAIIEALDAGEFHVFPDPFAQQLGGAYRSFAENAIEARRKER